MSPQRRQDTAPVTPGTAETLPPELLRLQATLAPHIIHGQAYTDSVTGNGVIASVAPNEPHKIEVNDPKQWNKAPQQLLGHELVHLLLNQLAGPVRNAIPADDPRNPYDLSSVDQLRTKGAKIWMLPQEHAARIVQTYIGDPTQRTRLQPWINDLRSAPLSIMDPTSPGDKTINRHPRAPLPPVEAYSNPAPLIDEARKRKP